MLEVFDLNDLKDDTMQMKDHYQHHYESGVKAGAEKPAMVDTAQRKKVQTVQEQQSEPMRADIVGQEGEGGATAAQRRWEQALAYDILSKAEQTEERGEATGGLGLGLALDIRNGEWAGMRVTELIAGSPAAVAGHGIIEVGDDLLSVDGQTITEGNYKGTVFVRESETETER